jgi:TRAP-type mannitol/chloroaromatic compound transport system permease small subunit
MQSSGWLGSANRAIGQLVGAGRWLVLPVALLLFLQWPLRDFVQHYSREANDLGQWLFALYISLALTYATRQRAHLAVDAIARGYRVRLREAIGRWGTLFCVAPWAVFMIVTAWPTVQRSVLGLEKFPESFNPGYFMIKMAAVLLALLALAQSLIDAARPRRET